MSSAPYRVRRATESFTGADERARLADRIRRARRQAKLTQAALANVLGITSSAVTQWEHPNGTSPEAKRLRDIAQATAVNIEWLLTGKGFAHRGTTSADETPALKLDFYARDDNEEALLDHYRSLSPRGRQMLCGFLDAIRRRKR